MFLFNYIFQELIENGKEVAAFLRIFDSALVVLLGKRSQASLQLNYRMFALKSTFPDEMFLVEVECSSRNLRSRSSFIFINASTSKMIYIWHGCKTSEGNRKLTKQFLDDKLLANKSKEFGFTGDIDKYDIVEVEEGKEKRDFFNLFNGSM